MAQLLLQATIPPQSLNPRRSASFNGKLFCARVGFSDFTGKEECRVTDEILKQLKVSNGSSSHTSCGVVDSTYQFGPPNSHENKALASIRTLILDNYDSYTYNLFQLLSLVNGVPPVVLKNDQLTFCELRRLLYQENAFDNVVISPGPGSPVRSSDIGICMQLLRECPDIPILGVCMGHQALGFAHGMEVCHAPEPVHGRLSEIEHLQHPLFSGIPSGSDFKVVRYHSLMLDISSLPPSLIATAWAVSEKLRKNKAQDGSLLMGVSHKTWPHHGVQFHPESIATMHGRKLLENFRDITRRYLENNPFRYQRLGTTRSFDTLRSLKPDASRQLRLCYKKLHGVLNAVGGSENIFRKLWGNSVENSFWLDSSNVDQERARFSYFGGKGASVWQKITYSLSNSLGQGVLRVENASAQVSERILYDGFFEYLDEEIQRYACKKDDYLQLPFDFIGGFVGYLGYELKCECGAQSNRHKSSLPDSAFFLVDRFIAVDHLTGDVFMVAVYEDNNQDCFENAKTWIATTSDEVCSLTGNNTRCSDEERSRSCDQKQVFSLSKSKIDYVTDVEKCLKYIVDGESYEICLTAQLRNKCPVEDLLGLYSVLREINPAPYAAWLHFGEGGPCICSSSPERFLQLDQTGTLEAKPIKGTVPRGESPAEDDILRTQLRESEKDQAENLMIVDLLRNDLGRVCVPGSVHVPHLMALETYSTVHTLVSTVRGLKRQDVTPVDCVKAAFPGGSMTGAPKLRTMEILDGIETSARGVYSGAIGFFSFNASFDLSIVIRTLVIQEGEVSIGAGGAIVALSDPESEYYEMLLKTKAPTRAVNICASKVVDFID